MFCSSGQPGDTFGYPGAPGAKGQSGDSGYPGTRHLLPEHNTVSSGMTNSGSFKQLSMEDIMVKTHDPPLSYLHLMKQRKSF